MKSYTHLYAGLSYLYRPHRDDGWEKVTSVHWAERRDKVVKLLALEGKGSETMCFVEFPDGSRGVVHWRSLHHAPNT